MMGFKVGSRKKISLEVWYMCWGTVASFMSALSAKLLKKL